MYTQKVCMLKKYVYTGRLLSSYPGFSQQRAPNTWKRSTCQLDMAVKAWNATPMVMVQHLGVLVLTKFNILYTISDCIEVK